MCQNKSKHLPNYTTVYAINCSCIDLGNTEYIDETKKKVFIKNFILGTTVTLSGEF